MDAAAVVLARNGWWGFKVSGVLRQAHMSTRSFYRQFETKDDLLAALLERDLLRMAGVIESLIDPAAPIPDRIWQYVGALISWGLDDEFAKPAALFASSYRGLLPQHPGLVERCLGALTAPLAEILAEGTRRASSQAVTRMLMPGSCCPWSGWGSLMARPPNPTESARDSTSLLHRSSRDRSVSIRHPPGLSAFPRPPGPIASCGAVRTV